MGRAHLPINFASWHPHRIACSAIIAALALATMLLPATARADDAYASTNVSMRAGPSTEYPRVLVVNAGSPITVHGCLQDYSWCDASFREYRGWIAGAYLTYPYQGSRVPIPNYGAQLGLAILSFSLNDYWGNYYRNRPWYGRRDYWNRHPPRPVYNRPPPRPRPPAIRPPPRPGPGPGVRPPRPGHGQAGPNRPGPNRPGPGRPGAGNRPPPGAGQGGRPPRPNPGSGNRPRPASGEAGKSQ